ncbi:MAG: hypothetical protein KDA05_11600 [Phycisphaerales bacterium]|nr:hypothetical protein [Phycisphaerales bacterium]
MNSFNTVVSILVLLVLASFVRGDDEIRVQYILKSSGSCTGGSFLYTYDAGESFTAPTLPSCTELVNIWAVDGESDIGEVTLVGTGSSFSGRLQVQIGSGAFLGATGASNPACGDFGGLNITDPTLESLTDLAGYIGGDLTGDITVGRLWRLDVDGAIQDTLTVYSAADTCIVTAGSSTASGGLGFGQNTVNLVRINGNCAGFIDSTGPITLIDVGGNLTGLVRSKQSFVLVVDVAGDIGAPGSPISMQAYDGFEQIIADSIHANIDAQYDPPGPVGPGDGTVFRLETRTGDFSGSMNTEFVTSKTGVSDPGFFIAGDLDAPITVQQDVRRPIEIGGDLNANITVTDQVRSRIVIGGSLVSGRTISAQALTEAGINGQVIINANNASGTWAGSVVVNGTTLATAPYYSNTALGGAVGLAPFRLHGLDCVPVDGGSVSTSDDSVTLRFYGPVKWTSGLPFSVEVCTGTCSEDVDVSNEFAATGNGTREITLTRTAGNFSANTVWHVRPVTLGTSALKCANLLTGSDVLVTTFTYDFGTP